MIREIFHDPELAVAIAFVIAIALTSKRVWLALTTLLDERAAKIKAELQEAQKLKDEAQKTLGHFQRKHRDALQDDLEALIERRQRLAAERIALAEAQAIAEVRNTAVDIAIGAARRVITEHLGDREGQVLIDQAIAELPRRLN
jgi:F-type H+-transporting ATPase subunit b